MSYHDTNEVERDIRRAGVNFILLSYYSTNERGNNLKTVKTSKELYYEVLKSFYLGAFQKGDRFLTYKEAQEKYNLSKQTIGVTYKRLQDEGFIRTEGANGTVVTFDLSDPTHLARVPFYRPQPGKREIDTYTVPIGILSSALYGGLICSSPERLLEYRDGTDAIVSCIREGKLFHHLEEELVLYVVEAMDNQYLSMIIDHFFSRYMYFDLESRMSDAQQKLLRDCAATYYKEMKKLFNKADYAAIPALTRQYYDTYYITPGALVFAKMGNDKFDRETALYGKLLHGLYVKIIEDGLRAGDYLPTIQQLCDENGVSKTTVRKAYAILGEMGLISSKVRDGTKLLAELDNPNLQVRLDEMAFTQYKSMKDAIEALAFLQWEIYRDEEIVLTDVIISQMRDCLREQQEANEKKGVPYLVSFIMVAPVLAAYPKGVVQKYFFYLTDIVDKLTTLYFFRLSDQKKYGEKIYEYMCHALDALTQGDKKSFWEHAKQALEQNAKLLLTAFEGMEREAICQSQEFAQTKTKFIKRDQFLIY